MCINQTKRKAFKSNSSSFPLANPKSYETIQHLYLYQNKNWPIKVSKNIANFKRCKTTIYSSVISWIKLLKNQSSQLQFVNTFNSNLILTIFSLFVFFFQFNFDNLSTVLSKTSLIVQSPLLHILYYNFMERDLPPKKNFMERASLSIMS